MYAPIRNSVFALAGLATLAFAAPASAQGVHTVSTTRMEFAGSMGTLMGALGHQEPTRSETWMQGAMMRTDDGETSTIFDLDQGAYTIVDHESRTWFRTTFAEMMDMAGQTVEGAPADAAGAPATEPAGGSDDEPDVEAEFELDVDRTGERRSFDGYEAERVVLTLAVEFTAEDDEGAMQEAGDMVLVSDSWISADFPSPASMMAGEQAAWMDDMQASSQETYAQVMAANPRVGVALERMQEEMEGLDGTALLTTSYVVVLAPGVELDREAVLALNDVPLSEGLGSVAGEAAGAAAQDAAVGAARRAVGRLGGLLGRNRDEPEEAPAPLSQSVLTRVTETVESVETGSFPADVFLPDPSYTERRPPWMGGG